MKQPRKPHYGFLIVAVYCLVLPAIFLFSNPIGLYMVPICEDLGISQGVYSLSRTFSSALCAASYLLYVPLQKRIGVRAMVCLGVLSGALAAFFYSGATHIAMIYIAATFNAFINPLASQTSMGNLVNAWFAKRNATVMSVIFMSGNLGGFFNAKLIAYWIQNYGWRASMRNTMLILLAVAAIAFLVLRDSPAKKKMTAWGAGQELPEPGATEAAELPGAVFRETLRSKKYYCLMIWAFMTGLITYPVINVIPALLGSFGYDTIFSGTAVSLISVGSLILLPFLGLSVDKWGVRPAGIFFGIMYLVSMSCILSLGPGRPNLALFATLSLGIANVLFPMLPMFIKDLFGFRDYSTYMSQANIVRMLGTSIGYPLLGFAHDMTGSYNGIFIMFAVCAVIMLVAGIIASDKKSPLWEETRPGYPGYKEREKEALDSNI